MAMTKANPCTDQQSISPAILPQWHDQATNDISHIVQYNICAYAQQCTGKNVLSN